MGAARKKKAEAEVQVPKVWHKAEFEFPSTFSYLQPDASAQFAIGSPIPSPGAVKLAVVDALIRWSGDVNWGRQVFNWLKTCEVHSVPPERVVRFRVFLKRLKPAKEGGGLTESVVIRDYFLMCGSPKIFLQVPQCKFEKAKDLLRKVRKLGTSDSVCWCCEVSEINESDLPKKFFPLKLVSLLKTFCAKCSFKVSLSLGFRI